MPGGGTIIFCAYVKSICPYLVPSNQRSGSPVAPLLFFIVVDIQDSRYPEILRGYANQLAKQGAKILFYPLNNFLPKNIADKWRLKSPDNLQKRAQENGCWVVSSDVVGSERERMSYGCTQIVSPLGKVVAFVPELKQGFVCASLYSL